MMLNMEPLILSALREDITSWDISAELIKSERGTAELFAKQNGVLAGLPVFERVFTLLDNTAKFDTRFKDGDAVTAGTLVGRISGDMPKILSGERTALNFLGHMSGIATLTREYAEILQGTKTKITDTRKTTPNMRIFEKYAVKVGGGVNHRYNLSSAIMLKDNHISAFGSITAAVAQARKSASFTVKIEVETETMEMVEEALKAKADIIMLDNMDIKTMRQAVAIIGGRAITECSGNITKERLREIADIGVDYVSSGTLTYAAGVLDLSLKNLHKIEFLAN
ncbi:nicotinate-nucleotide diphosphorylase (carboxylating) [Clostridia bacterium]|nr:nicotinate-nucleotide diphosphorylase (carboxylating) [Clostridia bacterium]